MSFTTGSCQHENERSNFIQRGKKDVGERHQNCSPMLNPRIQTCHSYSTTNNDLRRFIASRDYFHFQIFSLHTHCVKRVKYALKMNIPFP